MDAPLPAHDEGPSFRSWMAAMWLYTGLRVLLFLVLWALLYVLGLRGYIAALVAVVLSVPLSYVVLARPRARFASILEQRVDARRRARAELDAELEPDDESREQ